MKFWSQLTTAERDDGTVVWVHRYRANGRETRRRLGPAWLSKGKPPQGYLTRTEAEADAQRFMDRLRNTTGDMTITFGAAVARYLDDCQREQGLDASTCAGYKSILNQYLAMPWGRNKTFVVRPLNTFTEEDILALRDRLKDLGRTPSTINKHRVVIRGVFREDAVTDVWKFMKERRMSTGGEDERQKGRIRAYTPEQVSKLKEHALSDLDRVWITLGTELGLRMSEIRGLRIPSCDFEPGIVRIEYGYTDRGGDGDTKSHAIRSVPMSPNARAALQRYCAGREPYNEKHQPVKVFVGRTGGSPDLNAFYRRLLKAQKAAGLPRLTPHELRHTFGTVMVKKVQDIHQLQKLMGHKYITTTQGYLHYRPQDDIADIMAGIWDSDE